MRKRYFAFAVLLIFIAGCASPSPQKDKLIKLPDPSSADPHGRLVFALGGEVSVLNPILSTDSTSSAVEGTIFTGMTKINEKLEVVPDLAKSWRVSKDGRVWTFKLRRDVKWHDGHPFTAEDVVFTFNSILDPKVNSVRRSDYIIDGEPIKFKALDKFTVQALLPKPFAPFLVRSGMSVIPKHLLAGIDINTAAFNRQPVGTGPFILKEWVTGDHLTVVRNPNYYLGNPKLAEIIFKIIPDENARLVALEAGEIDQAGIPPKDYKRMKSLAGINVFEFDNLVYTYLGFNLANPKFKDKRVRQALAYATNKDQLVNLIFKGLASPAYAPSAPISWAYSDKVAKYPYNPEKARKLLAEAGAEELEFTILTNQGNKEREKAAVILQQQFKKVGVKVSVRIMEWSALLKIVNANNDPKDFETVLMGWSLGLDPDAYSIWHSSQYPRGFNFIDYHNRKVNQLLEKGRTTMAKDKRKKIYAKLWEEIASDQPYLFLWYPKTVVGVSERVGGLSEPGPAGLMLHLEKVFVIK
ncbi:MAG: peptide-binding protein [Candidatus Margulisbacteria bacterium]|nr:peptide-binding protein [Candidatus Margulisiibacteriota bacterium]